jgi:hypothetical protein
VDMAPSRSWTLAAVTTTASSTPKVSTKRWRLRPLTCLSVAYPWPPFVRGLDRLASDAPGAGLPLFPRGDAHIAAEEIMPHLPRPILLPVATGVIHDPPWRQIVGQHAPGVAAAQEIADGVQDLPLRVCFRSAAWFGFWNQMCDQAPFFVTEIGRV